LHLSSEKSVSKYFAFQIQLAPLQLGVDGARLARRRGARVDLESVVVQGWDGESRAVTKAALKKKGKFSKVLKVFHRPSPPGLEA
jgi:hypothetical protein